MIKKSIITALAILIISSAILARNPFARFYDNTFNFSILLPVEWKTSNVDMKYKRVIIVKKSKFSEIVITATNWNEEHDKKWNNWKNWYLKNIGSHLKAIVEKKDFKIAKDVKGTLLLFSYKIKRKKMLQKILLTKHKKTFISVECKSSLKSFQRNNEIFSKIMKSIVYKN